MPCCAHGRGPLGPQRIDRRGGGLGCRGGHVTVKRRNQAIDNRRQCRPTPVDRTALGPCIERLGVAAVRIDQTGENHPPEDAELEGGLRLGFCPLEPRQQSRCGRCKLGTPSRITGIQYFVQPVREAAFAAFPVGQTRVVTGNGVGDQFRHQTILPALGEFANLLRARAGVVNPFASTQPALKTFGIFAKVVQQPGEPGRLASPEFRAAPCRQFRHSNQVIAQGLPIALVRLPGGMREKPCHAHSSSLPRRLLDILLPILPENRHCVTNRTLKTLRIDHRTE